MTYLYIALASIATSLAVTWWRRRITRQGGDTWTI